MNSFSQRYAATDGAPPNHRHSTDHAANGMNGVRMQNGNGPLPMHMAAPNRQHSMVPGEMGAMLPFGGPRSPQKNKNTSHVPCKFHIQGACQAGRMCPFSHDLESTRRPAPCKYFSKGHCKFGRKCALAHINPDGTMVPRGSVMPLNQPFVFGGRPSVGPYGPPPPPGILSMQVQEQGLSEARQNGDSAHEEHANYQYGPKQAYDVKQIDMSYAPDAYQKYGSPPQQDSRFAASPPQKGLSVLDAPLPSSFDSQGISMAARNGPLASSVPSRFGLESPPSSLPPRSQFGRAAVRDLHNSAFGDRTNLDGVLQGLGSSPPSGADEPLTFPKRQLHSDRQRAPRQMMSASLGTKLPTLSFGYGSEEDDETDTEESNFLPASLHDLIDENKKSRRSSRANAEDGGPANFLAAQRRTISGSGTPQDSKAGSPHASSPSRYSGTFAARHTPSKPDEGTVSPSPFGHVGSPLRNSGFAFSSTSRVVGSSSGELSPQLSSPPRQAGMSELTRELQRSRLDAARSQQQQQGNGASQSSITRSLSNGAASRSSLDRVMSSTSVGRERIEEEEELFSMDGVGVDSGPPRSAPKAIPNGAITNGGANGTTGRFSPGNSQPTLGAIGGQRTTRGPIGQGY